MKTIEQTDVVSEQDKMLLGEVKRIVREVCPSAEVLLYGSVARGTQGPESDYDILVLTDELLSKAEKSVIRRHVLGLELDRNVVLSTIFRSKGEWERRAGLPFRSEVEKDGVFL